MAGYVLHLPEEKSITLSPAVVRRLIQSGSGDAALLYLCLVNESGSVSPERLRSLLKWEATRLSAAERALCAAGLIGELDEPPASPARAEMSAPEYSRDDITSKLERDATFGNLLREVERKLGALSTPSVGKLLGLYEYLGLPAEVIYLLVSHCVERKAEQFGSTRRPTMREVEKEGYIWARRELFSMEAANEYLREESRRRSSWPEYMNALNMGGRACAPSEEKYLSAWAEMGFPPETVALAYDKTVLRCHEFKWGYCNGILKKWHEKGLHTPDEVRTENKPARAKPASGDKNAWMDEFTK